MSFDYFVAWTADLPTPASIGLGSGMLPWPGADQPWARSGFPLLDSLIATTFDEEDLPEVVADALGGRAIARGMVVSRDDEFATLLAEAGGGLAWNEDEELMTEEELDEHGVRAARARLACVLWAESNPRPATPCAPFVAAAATGDGLAAMVLRAWAPSPHARPNPGVRNMGHDRDLNEQVFQAALTRPAGLAELVQTLVAHGYYPAARRPEFEAIAAASGVDVSYFFEAAKGDANERMRWFGTAEPLD